MKISELKTHALNESLAYVIGLIFPLEKTVEINGKRYLVGSVNHNPKMVTQEELSTHWKKIISLFDQDDMREKIQLVANRYRDVTISRKMGFSVLIESDCDEMIECRKILTDLLLRINQESEVLKKAFIRGCFDGRSSYDTTRGFLSIDVDRDYQKQDLVENIMTSLHISVNLNRRVAEYGKNDQIRIRADNINIFLRSVGMFSVGRCRLIEEGLAKKEKKVGK